MESRIESKILEADENIKLFLKTISWQLRP